MNFAALLEEGKPTWRWDLVCAMVEDESPPSRNEDDELVRKGYHFKKRERKARNLSDHQALKREFPDMYRAYQLWKNWDSERWLIEAGALTEISHNSLSDFVGHPPEVIGLYEELFFNIRPRLKSKGYVLNRILMPAIDRGLDQRDHDLMLKTVAYFSGWDNFVEFLQCGPLSDKARGWIATSFQDKLLKQGWSAAHRLNINNYNAIEVMTLVLKLKEIEKSGGGSDMLKQESMRALGALIDSCVTTIIPTASIMEIAEPRADEMLTGQQRLKYAGPVKEAAASGE